MPNKTKIQTTYIERLRERQKAITVEDRLEKKYVKDSLNTNPLFKQPKNSTTRIKQLMNINDSIFDMKRNIGRIEKL